MSAQGRLAEIRAWHARAMPLTGNGEMLPAVDVDALTTDVGWLLDYVGSLQSLLSAARCPDCDGSGGYMTGGYETPGELVQCQWCDERRGVDEDRLKGGTASNE